MRIVRQALRDIISHARGIRFRDLSYQRSVAVIRAYDSRYLGIVISLYIVTTAWASNTNSPQMLGGWSGPIFSNTREGVC